MKPAKQDIRTVQPTHPGEMLREDFLPHDHLSIAALAQALGVSRQSANDLGHTRRAVSPLMALRLSRYFGNSPEFWLHAQSAYDLWQAEREHHAALTRIEAAPAA
ncbi:MAG: HigA family addiction module antitoxin [Polyangiales bacterium]